VNARLRENESHPHLPNRHKGLNSPKVAAYDTFNFKPHFHGGYAGLPEANVGFGRSKRKRVAFGQCSLSSLRVKHPPIGSKFLPKGNASVNSYLPMSKTLITCREAGQILSVSDETIRRWFHLGTLPGVLLHGKTIRIYTQSVNSMMGYTLSEEGGVR